MSVTIQPQIPWWETTEFDFIRIPKELFRNPYYAGLTPESKLLYGFLLDRAGLSRSKGEAWLTPEGQPFVIFTRAEITQRLNCSEKKATQLLKNLKNIELIRVSRPKKDGPYHIVVLPFGEQELPLPTGRNNTCASVENTCAQVSKLPLNKTDRNNTDRNKTEITTLLEERIKSQIQYSYFLSQCPKNQLDAIVDVMVQTLMSTAVTITVAGVPMDGDVVRNYVQTAQSDRIEYIFDHMDTMTQPIRSYRSYFLARLCDPEGAVDAFYDQQHRLNDW